MNKLRNSSFRLLIVAYSTIDTNLLTGLNGITNSSLLDLFLFFFVFHNVSYSDLLCSCFASTRLPTGATMLLVFLFFSF